MEYSGGGDLEVNSSASNVTASCFSLEETHLALLVLHGAVLSVIVTCSVCGNGLVLLLVARFKELRTRSTVVSLCMVIADLLFTLCYTFPAIVTVGNKRWVFTPTGCVAFGFLASDLLITRWLIVGLLCLDRFCTVRFPFWYSRHGKWPIITLASLTWTVPIVISVVPIRIFVNYELRENQPMCLPGCTTEKFGGLCRIYYAGVFTGTFIMGTIMPLGLYLWLYRKARKVQKSAKHKLGRHTITIGNGILVPLPAQRDQKKEKQATATLVLIFVAVMVTGLPGFLLQLSRTISVNLHCRIPIFIHFIIIEIFLCAPMLTPLVIIRDRDFRRSIKKLLLCCGKKTGDLDTKYNSERRTSSEAKSFSNSRRSSCVEMPPTAHEGISTEKVTTLAKPTVQAISESCESITQ